MEFPVRTLEEMSTWFQSVSLEELVNKIGDVEIGDRNSKLGVVIIHGFTGSNIENLYLGNYLALSGARVMIPLLPGHGTDYEDLKKYRVEDWMGKVLDTVSMLREEQEGRKIVVVGHSLGGALATIAATRDTDIERLVLLASPMVYPFHLKLGIRVLAVLNRKLYYAGFKFHDKELLKSPIVKYFDRQYEEIYYSSVREAMRAMGKAYTLLPKLSIPVKMIYGTSDYRVPTEQAESIYQRIGSESKELVWVEKTDHVIVIDSAREEVAEEVLKFVRQCQIT